MILAGGQRPIVSAALVALLALMLVRCGGTGGGPSRSFTQTTTGGTATKTPPPSQAPSHTLTVSANPASGGSVFSNPAGINCGSACSVGFVGGTTVALTVAPATGKAFLGWGGSCSGIGGCSITLDSDKTVTASFGDASPAQAVLSVIPSGGGSGTITSAPAGINCGSTCSAAMNLGTAVSLSATPAPASAFAGWSGAACAGTGVCTVALNADTSVSALFVPVFTLSVTKGGTGSGAVSSAPAGIICGSTCSLPFAANTVVTLAATPAAGSAFTGWGGAC